jgi:hypothetical protein
MRAFYGRKRQRVFTPAPLTGQTGADSPRRLESLGNEATDVVLGASRLAGLAPV